MDLHNKKIGIWGYGIVGQSAARFLKQFTDSVTVMDQYYSAKIDHAKNENITLIPQDNIEQFFSEHDYVLASPGIDLRPFEQYRLRLLTELDLFYYYFKKPIIAITGTVGKTTVTHLLSKILQSTGRSVACGGNIGVGMLDLISQQYMVDYAVIEVSSFQLEYTRFFVPDLAIITNIYNNHLDRHNNLSEYMQAKLCMVERQTENQYALIPHTLKSKIRNRTSKQLFFSIDKPDFVEPNDVWIENDCIMKQLEHDSTKIALLREFPAITFQENWLIIAAALCLLDIKNISTDIVFDSDIQKHRLELIGTIKNNITLYNDSKSTIAQATIAAAHKLQDRPTILILGGISKVQDPILERKQLLSALPKSVKLIIAFGQEANLIRNISNLPCNAHPTLDEAFHDALMHAQQGDQILFSPGGSSYDLYENFKVRGFHFTQLGKSAIQS